MTLQEIFDKSIGGLIQQGTYGYADGRCWYRYTTEDETVLKCAAGQLMIDELYESRFDAGGGIPVLGLNSQLFGFDPNREGKEKSFLQRLQSIHDQAAMKQLPWDIFIDELKEFATEKHLEWKFG